MSQNERNLNFNMSYKEVIAQSFEKETYLTRDLVDLTPRGITAARIAAMLGLRDVFVAIPSDDVMLAKITLAKDERDAAAEPLRIAIREVQGIAANTFGRGSAQHKVFTPQTLSLADAESLYMLSSSVVTQGTAFLTPMAVHGLTAAMLTNITALATALKPKIKAFSDAEANQLLTTQNRHNAANALFNEMSAMCETAIIYYQDRNPLKASLYFIYDEGSNAQQRNGSVLGGVAVSRKFDTIKADSSFKMKAFDGNDLQMYFSKEEGGAVGTKSITVISNAVDYKLATAADLGYSAASGIVHFCIKNSGAVETGFRVVMEG